MNVAHVSSPPPLLASPRPPPLIRRNTEWATARTAKRKQCHECLTIIRRMPVVRWPIHQGCGISIKVYTNTHAPTDAHMHLPEWIISGFPQWLMVPVHFSFSLWPSPASFPSQWASSNIALIHIYWFADSSRALDLYVSRQTMVKPQSLLPPFISRSRRYIQQNQPGRRLLSSWPSVSSGRAGKTRDAAQSYLSLSSIMTNGFDVHMSVKLLWQSQ